MKNGTTPNNNLIEFKVDVFWMSLIMEDDKPVKPTDISLLCTEAEMICANYFPDMVIKFDPFICGQLLTFYATDLTYYAAFYHNLRIYSILY